MSEHIDQIAHELALSYWRGYWTRALGRIPESAMLRRYALESRSRFRHEAERTLRALQSTKRAGEDAAGDSPASVPPARGVSRSRPPTGG